MKVVGYNIQYALGKDGRVDLGRVAETVAGADVIALQEVERNWPRSGMVDQPAELAALLPEYYWVYGPPYDVDASSRADDGRVVNRRRQFGNMLLARWPIVSTRLYPLPTPAAVSHVTMDMGALEGVIETEDGALRVYSVHLDSISNRNRMTQIARLREIVAWAPAGGGAWSGRAETWGDDWTDGAPPPMPRAAVMLGDFNLAPGSPEYEAIVGRADPLYGRVAHDDDLIDVWVAAGHAEDAGITWPGDGRFPAMRLDYCFVTAELAGRVRGAWIDDGAQGSDHQPMWAEIAL